MSDHSDTELTTQEVSIYQVRLDLKDIHPPIWRRLLLRSDTSLGEVHYMIQIAMGWTDEHMHMFTSGGQDFGDTSVDDYGDTLEEQDYMLYDVLTKVGDKLIYEYDFGDDWVHTLRLEKILPIDPDLKYPICVTGRRACPPEDVGGTWGYQDFLAAVADPEHPEHTDMIEWGGEDFDPEHFSADEVTAKLQGIAEVMEEERYRPHVLTGVRHQMLSPEATMLQAQLRAWGPGSPPPDINTAQLLRRIRATRKPQKLVELLPAKEPELITIWAQRVHELGAAAIPSLIKRLANPDESDPTVQIWVQGQLACALHRIGPASVPPLLAAFDTLDEAGQALACLVFGQLHAHEATDCVWHHFERAFANAGTPDDDWALGSLWALADLEDPRMPDAIARALGAGWYYPELAAMAARFGDERAFLPLLGHSLQGSMTTWSFAGAALIVLSHRVPRQQLIDALAALPDAHQSDKQDQVMAIVDTIMGLPTEEAEDQMAAFFTPMTTDQVFEMFSDSLLDEPYYDPDDYFDDDSAPDEENLSGIAFDGMGLDPESMLDAEELDADESPFAPRQPFRLPFMRPGRNDPCWCGSGKKYKDCHWRQDQQEDMPKAA